MIGIPALIDCYGMLVTVHSIIITPLTTTGTLTVYVDRLKRVYQNPPTTWLPLPNCKHIKLAVTKEKGMRHGREPDAQIEHKVRGEIRPLMDRKVLVDMDSIFDDGTFENARRPMVILVEGALGSGKTSLAYHYCQKWAEGNLSMFDMVALVYLRHPDIHSAGLDLTLHQLLLLACASDDEKEIEDIVGKVVQHAKDGLKLLLLLDGWDEAPACLRNPPNLRCPPDNSFLGKLLRFVSSNTIILITSRPDSSLDLHNRANVNRVEILGFTKESIHDYFQEALSTQLSSDEVKDEIADLPTMGVLQRVQWFSISSKTMSYNFVHLSIQELLAAYCISIMKESKQVRVFQTLLGEPRFSAVLQFYAGFTKLTNQLEQ